MKKLYYFSFSLLLFSCGTPQEPNLLKDKEPKKLEPLTLADLFNGQKVDVFLNHTKDVNNESKELFLKGVDAFRNKQELDSAMIYFEQSLVGYPTANAYYDLGNVYLALDNFEMASKAFSMAEHLDFEPFSKVLFNRAIIAAKQEKIDESLNYIEIALQAGFHDLDLLNNDPSFEKVRKSYGFNETLLKGLRGMSGTENLFWLQFKKEFPLMEFPVHLEPLISEAELGELEFISYDFERFISEMRDEKFAREVSKGFYYVGHFNRSEDITCILYLVRDEYYDETGPIIYRLATYNEKGKLIDKMDIAGAESYQSDFKEVFLHDDFTMRTISSFPVYEKDVEEFGYYDNEITGFIDSVNMVDYFINLDGRITKSDKLIPRDEVQSVNQTSNETKLNEELSQE